MRIINLDKGIIMKEINLFVGPLGTAHLRAASFASGMMKSFAIAELLDRVESEVDLTFKPTQRKKAEIVSKHDFF